jgi:oxygen-dependent protoporphyrinogen oxidase
MSEASAEGRHVVVVGGGLAGLAAGFAHAQRGARVSVLEAAARVGGRAAPDASGVDPIAARVSTADRALFGLVRAAGLGGALLPIRPVRSARAEAGRVVPLAPGADPRTIARLPGVSLLQALRVLRLPRLMARYAPHLDAAAPERAAPLDYRSLADFATLYFGRGIATGWIEPWLAERAPQDEREASRASFLLRWSSERDAVEGSFAAPVARLLDALAARLAVRTNAPVERVEPGAKDGFLVRLANETIAADAVVLAVPAPAALRIAEPVLVAAERTILAGVRYDAAITWTTTARTDATARVRIAPRGTSPLASIAIEAGTLTAIARDPWAAAHLEVAGDALAKELAMAVERVLPGAAAPGGSLHRFPLAWPRFDVGAYRAIARMRAVEADRVRAGRALHFAGDWLAAPTLEGAAVSAMRLP